MLKSSLVNFKIHSSSNQIFFRYVIRFNPLTAVIYKNAGLMKHRMFCLKAFLTSNQMSLTLNFLYSISCSSQTIIYSDTRQNYNDPNPQPPVA